MRIKRQGKMPKEDLIRNIVVTSVFLLAATTCSALFLFIGGNRTNVGIVFMLAVMLTARYTDGYVPGIVASVFGVICVNYVFTYPFMELDFTLDGYPVTFIAMLLIFRYYKHHHHPFKRAEPHPDGGRKGDDAGQLAESCLP